MGQFEACFAIIVGTEGGLTLAADDPGNWTGGAVGRGVLRGTKFGVSAAAFPNIDIAALTIAQAQAIYRSLYWARVLGDQLPPALALLVFDAAINSGAAGAAKLLQAALGITADGLLGSATLASLGRVRDIEALCAEFLARRLLLMASLGTWKTFGAGWARRVCRLPYQAAALNLQLAKASQ